MDDLISRQAAIDAVTCGALSAATLYGRTDAGTAALKETVRAIKALPSAQPECEDAVSRQAVIEEIANIPDLRTLSTKTIGQALARVPTVQGKSGWWLIRSFGSDAKCSECGMYFKDVYDMENSDNYCRHCGTKMNGLKLEEEADV